MRTKVSGGGGGGHAWCIQTFSLQSLQFVPHRFSAQSGLIGARPMANSIRSSNSSIENPCSPTAKSSRFKGLISSDILLAAPPLPGLPTRCCPRRIAHSIIPLAYTSRRQPDAMCVLERWRWRWRWTIISVAQIDFATALIGTANVASAAIGPKTHKPNGQFNSFL